MSLRLPCEMSWCPRWAPALVWALVTVVTVSMPGPAAAQDFPVRPITLIVPFRPEGWRTMWRARWHRRSANSSGSRW